MIKNIIFIVLLLLLCSKASSQNTDSVLLNEIVIQSYINRQSLMRVTGAVNVVDTFQMQQLTHTTLLPVVNSLPGVRLEERSPSSYRISLRGSLLRSPFGVRNVKVYYNEFPLTDASGNTYFNVLSRNAVENIEVLKGPDGSLFGANSGGVISLNNGIENYPDIIKGEVRTGSYDYWEENILYRKKFVNNTLRLFQSYETSHNYRVNSASQKTYVDINNQWKYKQNKQLEFLGIFSHLNYHTPGGLTLDQMLQNPRAARPATATMPGAEEQKNGTNNLFYYGGVMHRMQLQARIEHTALTYISYADYRNRFITNYEKRDELTAGWRTYFLLKGKQNAFVNWNYILGSEGSVTGAKIANYDNNKGLAGDVQSKVDMNTFQHFYFSKWTADINNKWNIDASLSLNFYQYNFKNEHIYNQFKTQWMPRLGASYLIRKNLIWRATIAKGYSPPTSAEIRPSDNNIYTSLQPEKGWNYETGVRWSILNSRLFFDISAYQYRLQEAIVRRVNASGAEYFVNAGGTNQKGFEVFFNYKAIVLPTRFIKKLDINSGFSRHFYLFKNYIIDTSDYSGNKITGVPDMIWTNNLHIEFPLKIALNAYHNYTSSIPLNDDNNAFTNPYNIIQLRLSKEVTIKWVVLNLNVGVDNLLNVSYSLGNDLNAFGRRYYNPAPKRNYWTGIKISGR